MKTFWLLFLLSGLQLFSATHTVRMSGNRFNPASLTIQAGDTVTWVNDDFAGHDTVHGTGGIPAGTWRSPLFGRGGSFSFTFNVAPGTYPYYCTPHVGIGMVGSITVAAPPNPGPVVTITSPAQGASFTVPASFTFSATASDPDGVANVFFLRGNALLGTDTSAPYSVTVSLPQAGTYNLRAIARDNLGAAGTNSVTVVVTEVVNTPPSIRITAPANNSNFTAPATFDVVTESQDAEGISNVEFFVDGGSVGVVSIPPFLLPISIPIPGIYQVSAIVTDTAGAQASTNIAVIIEDPPAGTLLVSLNSPTNGQEFVFPASVPISAIATNELTQIAQVSFFIDGTLLATDTSPPYETTSSGLQLGEHLVGAVGLDARGQQASNSVLIFIIEPPNLPPTLSLTVSESGSYQAQQTVSINAQFSDPDGLITNITFISGNAETVLRTAPASPQLFRTTLAQGTNFISVIVTDNRGLQATADLQLVALAAPTDYEILFKDETGRSAIWRVAGSEVLSQLLVDNGTPINPGWRIITRGDLDGDNNPELLLQQEDGTLGTWHLQGATISRFQMLDNLPPFGRAWKAAGLGDVSGDGKLDIIWRHDLGYVAAYLMSGIFFDSGDLVSENIVPADWKLAAVFDANNDGTDDLIWQLPDGTTRSWIMRGGKLSWASEVLVTATGTIYAALNNSDGSKILLASNSSRILQIVSSSGVTSFPNNPLPSGWIPIAITFAKPSTTPPQLDFLTQPQASQGGNLLVTASASDPFAQIINVQFWLELTNNTNYLGLGNNFSGTNYSIIVPLLEPGFYRLRATALNSAGLTTSKVLPLTVPPLPSVIIEPYGAGSLNLVITNIVLGFNYEVLESRDLRNWTPIARPFKASSSSQSINISSDGRNSRFYQIRRLTAP